MPRDSTTIASPPPSTWHTIAADLRQALIRSGRPAAVVDRVLAGMEPVFRAVERARGVVDDELAWALLAVAADHARRRARDTRR